MCRRHLKHTNAHSNFLIIWQGHCFGGSGYFGVGEPQFFYADMTALTLGKIIRLLGFTFSLPPPVAATGFPEGASVSDVISDALTILFDKLFEGWFLNEAKKNILSV